MSKPIVFLCLLISALLTGCPDNIGFWQGGCPSWEPNHTTCVQEQCEADLSEGVAREDSEACVEIDRRDPSEGDTASSSDT